MTPVPAPPARAPSATGHRLARAAVLLAVATVLSRLLGLVREIVTAALFGASNAKAAYVIGYYLPFFIQRLLLGGTLSIVFIPTITEYLARGDRRETVRVTAILFNLVLLLGVGMVLAGQVLAPLLVPVAAPGFHAQPGLVPLAVALMRIIFVAMLFLALAVFATGFLQAHQRFTVPALAPLLFNVVIILGTLWLGPRVGIHGLAVAWVLGTAAQFLVQLPAMARSGFRWLPLLDLRHPAVRQLGRLAAPAMLGLAIVEINAYVARFFASFLPVQPGVNAVAVLDYAYEVMQAPVGIIAISIATALFPTLARQAAARDRGALAATTALGLRMTLLLMLPVAALLLALAPQVVRVLFERGEFTPAATAAVAAALRGYAVGMSAVGAYYVVTRAFYALHDMATPVRVGALAVLLNAVLNAGLMRVLGATGIALAASLVNLTNVGLLLWLLRARLGALEGRRTASSLLRGAGAAAAAALLAAAVAVAADGPAGEGPAGALLVLAASGGVGVVAYLGAAWLLRLEELRQVPALLRGARPGRLEARLTGNSDVC
ncbi:MAG: murein biosynthesis integral membrane protein MurJ [Armatimonadota bacterium]|nr:murein biosynthesis integral membrane protein MurJ [Armatimonadota bacterium]MDR7448794.1 murein biosynthesis integral membrane protein MurJ [Armatimonadota bacterium]MDR7460524.1 murein biosynthesis integral membrane protein MurJ [Armatimonadota bacterium]MDR7479634.1 murein biosynthesis integral membrane protein MurJ [Armatimonadota bacterium]MDR7490803.1 murein biosynthesis integral membrane protein MurJ [Armatimonadota bacterium]